VDSGAEVDIDILVGGTNVRENHWACLILVVRLQALLQGMKAALCNAFLRYPSPTLVLLVVNVVVWDLLGFIFVF
jgi:hypothetical protein